MDWKKVGGLFSKMEQRRNTFPTLEDHQTAQKHAEEAVESHAKLRENTKAVMKEFKMIPPRSQFSNLFLCLFFDLSTCGPMVSLYMQTEICISLLLIS